MCFCKIFNDKFLEYTTHNKVQEIEDKVIAQSQKRIEITLKKIILQHYFPSHYVSRI